MYAVPHTIWLRALGLAIASMLWGGALQAQVQVGSETQLNLDGTVSGGYSGSMTNDGGNSHGFIFGGTGNLSGSYHSPQFLSFDVVPFYNQSRNNSSYQSITDSSGINANANIFSGSQFPGYVSYSKVYNSESNNYAVPGLASYATNGNTQAFGVGWAANFKALPSVNFGYQQGDSNYSLYGTQQESSDRFHSVFGLANYNIDGFHLSGGIHFSNTDSVFPNILAGTAPETANGDITTYNFSMSRAVDRDGTTWCNFTRNTTNYEFEDVSNSATSDILTGGVSLRPTKRLYTTVSADYDDNLAGSIYQQVTSTGALVPVTLNEQPSHSWGVVGNAQYSVLKGLYVDGMISHRQQLFEGTSYDSNAYSGSVFYGRDLLGGQLSTAATVTESTYENNNTSMLGFLTNVIYIRKIGEWGLSGSFGYSQNTQTILIAYTSSGYSFSASVNRRIIGHIYWNAGANASKSELNQVSGYNNTAQGYSTGIASRWLSVSGAYSKSSGNGLLTSTGVTPLPPGVPPPLIPTVLYSGTTYSASVGSTPIQGLTITGSAIWSRNNTSGDLATLSNNNSQQAYVYLTYKVRKVYLNAGYSRLLQGFSATGLPPTLLSTYYVGLSRWFRAF
jgi:hypothetical protein